MAQSIPENALDLFQKPVLAHLATVMPDGTPQVTPVWVDFDGTYVIVNTSRGRQKELNMRKRPQVGLDIVDPTNAGHWISVRGKIAAIIEEGALEHANKLTMKYMGKETYPNLRPGEVRVICKITPERVIAQ